MERVRCQGCYCNCCPGCHLRPTHVRHDHWCRVQALEDTGAALMRAGLSCVSIRDIEFDDNHFAAIHRLCHTMCKLQWSSCTRLSGNKTIRTQVPISVTKRCILLICRIGDKNNPSLSDSFCNGELLWGAILYYLACQDNPWMHVAGMVCLTVPFMKSCTLLDM